ncbi:trifunctional dihydropteroate synthetase [Malassezia brasiliensis]|uniref:Folic acid synthesis protein FOL1 n=1 Tax=Malassezia brasiliensis TaxID=1821822 RepID=A0AAF0IQC6_9BASI|nr:trifunctional dihydropteroate synthetase [Malassezia brasiliensis]
MTARHAASTPARALAQRAVHLRDTIAVRGLEVRMCAGRDAWGRAQPQPVHIDAVLRTDVARAGTSDHLPYSLNYGEVYRALEEHCRTHAYDDVGRLAEALAAVCQACRAPYAEVTVRLPRALLRAAYVGVSVARADAALVADAAALPAHDRLVIEALEVFAILGVNPWERETRQRLRISLDIAVPRAGERGVRYEALARAVEAFAEASAYQTVERLATEIARIVVVAHGAEEAAVRVEKPSAIMYAACASVEVVRDRAFFQDAAPAPAVEAAPEEAAPPPPAPRPWTSVLLALGSNLGDRVAHIDAALTRLDAHPDVRVVDTSFLYETQPMYYVEQPRFLNGACRILTRLAPHDLLALTQAIETDVGRDKTNVPRNGPRVVDVDLVLYGDAVIADGERLVVPHPRLAERAFVLLPLADVAPHAEVPTLQRTVAQLLSALAHTPAYAPHELARVLPVGRHVWHWGARTHVMGILNATPDSFSDGGEHLAVEAAVEAAVRMVRAGADVLDVGGQSTAPHAPEVPEAEERARVVRVVEALVARGVGVPISVDTYRASVAAAALDAGAAMVNDVSGGTRDAAMLPLVAARRCPYVAMHMRGDAQTMAQHTDYGGDVPGVVAAELGARVRAALGAGVRRWNLVVDPGIGFAKDAAANVALLRALPRLVGDGTRGAIDARAAYAACGVDDAVPNASLAHFPLLLGVSRKAFLGRLIQAPEAPLPEPKARVYATLAACTAAIATRCVDVIRVHDVEAAVDTVRTADALVRPRAPT